MWQIQPVTSLTPAIGGNNDKVLAQMMELLGCQVQVSVGLFLVMLLPTVSGLPQGAPESVCDTMLPFHAGGSILPENSVSPFTVKISDSVIASGQTLRVDVTGVPAGLAFAGFMIQARNRDPPFEIVGQFNLASGDGSVKLMNCENLVNNSATHAKASSKPQVSVEWKSPMNFLGQVVFNATVAGAYNQYWTVVLSNPIKVVKRDLTASVVPLPTRMTTTKNFSATHVTYVPTDYLVPNAVMSSSSDLIYNNCGSSKTCFGLPNGCISSKSCISITAVTVRGDLYEFELQSGNDTKAAYVAVGLSEDTTMGEDLVIECVRESGRVNMYSSYTSASPYAAIRSSVSQKSARLLNASFVDGVIYCKVQREPLIFVHERTFDLRNSKFHLLVAAGTTLKVNSIGFHDIGRSPSVDPINLAVTQDLGGSTMLLVRLHGAFMISAWIGTTSLGIIFARYLKQTWVGNKSCGKDLWFSYHRLLMMTTWALTVSAYVFIWVELKRAVWHAHSITGLIAVIFCFIQPIGAWFRPEPTDENRPYFNWGHWLGGNLSHIMAIVAIFFSVELPKAELPVWMDWILVTFVVVHVLTHLIFSIAGAASERQMNQQVTSFQMDDLSHYQHTLRSGTSNERRLDAPYARLRKGLLSVYGIIIILYVSALVLLVFMPLNSWNIGTSF